MTRGNLEAERVELRLPIILPDVESPGYYFLCKRVADVVIALVLLIALAPLLMAIAVAIRFDSPGPLIYVQQRVGSRRRKRNGRTVWEVQPFPFYKFRSMMHGADERLHREHIRSFCEGAGQATNGERRSFKLADDPRITAVGRVLRRSSLDELPQLINVLRGEMSLVGPRPVPIYEAAAYSESQWERLAAFPGISGQWQVYGRSVVPFEEMIRMDIEYARRRSLALDLKLLLLTVPAVFGARGAQ
jgi:lipopolysaccharide/colanic/teichoic acid biosynthesis glycosyltransferase